MRPLSFVWFVIALATVTFQRAGFAQALAPARPELLGMSSGRLARIDSVINNYVRDHRIAGTVTLVLRDGKVAHFTAAGLSDVERGTPMSRNAIFRIASQSKALTSVAIMILVEEGRLRLGDSLGRFIPAFARTTVGVDSSDAAGHKWIGRVPSKRGITVRDLLTHTSGISYGGGPLDSLYRAAGYHSWYFADKDEPIGASIERLATLPFERQPGEAFVYGYNTDILGYLVEKVSGMTLAEFIRQRITQPLRMEDTYFYLPKEKAPRLAAVYSASSNGIVRAPDPLTGQGDYVTGPRKSFSGGAGLLSTATDYARFLQMLLNGGELDGVRILSPKTVQLMTTNHVDTLYSNGRQGFGLGFSVLSDPGRAGIYGSPGAFGWGGAYFSSYWVDPAEHMVVVFMTQLLPSGGSDLQDKLRTLVYQSIVKSYQGERR